MSKNSIYEREDVFSLEVIPGAASLLKHLDKRILVWLRDGRLFMGKLRSVDQFNNLIMYEATERVYNKKEFGDIPQGVLMVRGENIALLGESTDSKDWRYGGEKLLASQVQKDDAQTKITKLKTLAYWKRGLIFSSEDYF
ncbi:u6 snRNA-associated Sm-like protein LSm1 [Caerostris darwini]|uniref:U6 snRNA-associated Sm-like protein LSm1 n=1 Tax=Caerostris darwini TaxID=1538125 RepID=A0AAV4UCJ9_9ARAC|nr:u6 snRNA-associated Sm-like protein LSm1 [Caerostris darwini]